ncbi:MAG TPA: ABC transporter permease, partial [Cytophagales bacterium]|nr:ABC transporter permease [Cytophagales bacterium]
VIVGIGMAQKLGLQLNDNLVVMTGEGITRNFRVIGIFETTMAGADNSKAYTRINSARQLLSKNQGYVTDIQVNMQDFEQADAAAEQLADRLPYQVESWKVANGQLDAGNELRNIIAIAVSLTILLVAGFGIYNIMNMTVNEKIKEIAILKAMGFAGRDVVQIFLSQSLIIGLLGGLVGMGLGYVVSAIVNHVPFEIATLTTLPVAFRPIDYAMAISFGLVTTFVAGYLPAKKASQVDPVSIIRG